MARFLPRLIRNIKASPPSRTPTITTRNRRRTVPTVLPYPSFSPLGRKQSILLDDVNPIMHPGAFTHRKLDAPLVPSVTRLGKHPNSSRKFREMTELECQWWSNPYLRMLASPLRQCMITDKCLPVDFMIRLAPLKVHGPRLSKTIVALLPDGVQHPRFRRRNSGRGFYLLCRKQSIEQLVSRSSYKRIPTPSKLHVHSLLASQIGHQLRLKVLQELELLAESLRCAPQSSREHVVLRRLTRTEWAETKTTGRISQSGAVAVLIVPPLNKLVAKPEVSNDAERESPPRIQPDLPPVSVLHETQAAESLSIASQPVQQVPLYSGLALFPCRTLRSKFHRLLNATLHVERRARWKQNVPSRTTAKRPSDADGKRVRDKASHAYLLRCDCNTIRRADSVPLALALWRIRMWEGQGWEDEIGSYGGWAAKLN